MASASGTMKYLTTPLTPFLNRGLEFAKLRAQERNVRLTERQRIGRDGCVQAVLARFLALSEEDQDRWIEEGVIALLDKPQPGNMDNGLRPGRHDQLAVSES